MKRYTLRSPSPKHEVWAVQRIWESGLKGDELLVAAILSMHGSPQGTDMRPSVATIAWWTSLSARTVQRVLKSFRNRGYLVVTREADNTEHRATEYSWNFQALPGKLPLPKFLEECRKLKRAAETRRIATAAKVRKNTKTGSQTDTPAGRQIVTPAGCQIVTPKKGNSGVTNRRFRGDTALSPEVNTEVGATGVDVPENHAGEKVIAAAVCVEKQPPDTNTPALLEAAFLWTEANPWTYRKFAEALAKAIESTPAHDLNIKTLALEKGLQFGVPPRYAVALALAPMDEEEDMA